MACNYIISPTTHSSDLGRQQSLKQERNFPSLYTKIFLCYLHSVPSLVFVLSCGYPNRTIFSVSSLHFRICDYIFIWMSRSSHECYRLRCHCPWIFYPKIICITNYKSLQCNILPNLNMLKTFCHILTLLTLLTHVFLTHHIYVTRYVAVHHLSASKYNCSYGWYTILFNTQRVRVAYA